MLGSKSPVPDQDVVAVQPAGVVVLSVTLQAGAACDGAAVAPTVHSKASARVAPARGKRKSFMGRPRLVELLIFP